MIWKCEHAAISNFCKRYRENPQIEEGSAATEPSRTQDPSWSEFDKQVKGTKEKMSKSAKSAKCDVSKIELSAYEQWKAEQGYWIGEYTFLQKDGIPNVSAMELSLSVL